MLALIGIIIALIFIYMISFFVPRSITTYQIRFMYTASIIYIIVFGFMQSTLMGNEISLEVLKDNKRFIPLGFFITWYFIVSIISNLVGGGTENKDYQGFFSNRNTQMSERRTYVN